MESGDGLNLPKLAVAIELAVHGHGACRVEVFVAMHVSSGYRPQHVLEVLESSESFLPTRPVGGERFTLVNKAAIVWVRIALAHGELPVEESAEVVSPTLFDVVHRVAVELSAGEVIEGHLMYSSPFGQARVIDYLNRTDRFVRLWTSEHLYLLNKAFVIGVTERDASARSATLREP